MTQDVLNHLRDLEENLKDWERYRHDVPLGRFLSDRDARHAWLHAALVSLQAAIDAANHWAASISSQRPESYRAIADLLAEEGAIAPGLARKLKGLFSLRNVLIHKYQDLVLETLFQRLQRGPEPLRQFLGAAKRKLRSV